MICTVDYNELYRYHFFKCNFIYEKHNHFCFQAPRMLSGGAAGLVSVDILRKEQEDIRRREKRNKPLEGLKNSH